MFATGELKLKSDLCDALGLVPGTTRKIIIVIEPDDVVTAHVVSNLTELQLSKVCDAIRVAQADEVRVIEAQAIPVS
jgi:hypothetical protein